MPSYLDLHSERAHLELGSRLSRAAEFPMFLVVIVLAVTAAAVPLVLSLLGLRRRP